MESGSVPRSGPSSVDELVRIAEHLSYFGYDCTPPEEANDLWKARHHRHLTIEFRSLPGWVWLHGTRVLCTEDTSRRATLLSAVEELNSNAVFGRYTLDVTDWPFGTPCYATRCRGSIAPGLPKLILGTQLQSLIVEVERMWTAFPAGPYPY